MKVGDATAALRTGAETAAEIADELEMDRSHCSRELRRLAETHEEIERGENPDGRGYVYYLTDAAESDDAETELRVLGDREYEWQTLVPEPEQAVYQEVQTEKTEIAALIDHREETGQLGRVRLRGPPGTGKTTLAETIAAERRWPYIEVQLTASMREPDLYGSPQLVGGTTLWADGPITRALLCSQERPTLLVLDEINRATPKSKTALMSALDHRARVTLQARGNEVIQGNSQNLVVVSTMNQGAEFATFDLDPAEKRRLGPVWDVPHMGLVNIEREAQLVAGDAPVSEPDAAELVEAANAVREAASDPEERRVDRGIAVSDVVVWAQQAAALAHAGERDAVLRAAESAVIRRQYDRNEAVEAVRELLTDALDGAGVDPVADGQEVVA